MDGSGVYSSLNDCEQECTDVSSINENIIDVNIFPNPSSNIFNLEFYSDTKSKIVVTNVIGEQVYIESTKSVGEFKTQIDLSNYSKGIYNLTIKTSDGISNHKLILQ
ncbi:T9SS type A sorting domain-containing protein [Flavobacteriales bacterium]|nr:T9SS type A sorting domain-containing protein [Flavobacteriales bacterium]